MIRTLPARLLSPNRFLYLLCAFLFLFAGSARAQGGGCECTNCPQFMEDLFVGDFEITVQNASNPTLGQNGQGVCAVIVHWDHTAICDISITLTSPSGQTVTLVAPIGQFCTSNGNAGTDWNVTFLPCGDPNVMPDPGFSSTWNNNQPWGGNNTYTGSYYPFSGCLQNFSGPVNGVWTLTVTDGQANDTGNLYDYEIIFCDPSGINCFNCEADAGALPQPDVSECEMSPNLSLDLPPNYTFPDVAPPAGYSYAYVVAGLGGVIQAIDPSPDLSGLPAGNYTVCGLSYLTTDANKIPAPNGVLTLNTLTNQINSPTPPFCADITSNCVNVTIKPLPPDEEEYVTLCAPMCHDFYGQFYCATGDYPVQVLGPNGCPFTATLHLTINEPDQTNLSETVCPGDCSANPLFSYACTAGNYQEIVQNVNGCDSIVSLNLVVLNVVSNIQPPPVLSCGQTSALLSGAGSTTGAGVNYLWTASNGGTIIGANNQLNATIGSAGNYSLRVCRTLGGKTCCDSTAVTVTSNNVLPAAPAAINGDSTLCLGQNQVFSIAAVNGASGYTWTVPPGVSILSGQNTTAIDVNWNNAGPGSVCVTAENTCGSGPATCIPVSIETLPQPGIPQGDSAVCGGASEIYTIPLLSNAGTYTWTVSAPDSIVSGQGSNQVLVQWANGPTGVVCVSAANACGTSAPQCLNVVIDPPLPPAVITGDSALCSGSTGMYNISPIAGASDYSWTVPAGGTLVSGQNSTGIVVDWTAAPGGPVCVTPNSACGAGPQQCFAVVVNTQPVAFAGADTALCGADVALAAVPGVAGSSGNWTAVSGPGTATFANAGNDSTTVTVSANGVYQFQWTENNAGCSDADSVQVYFNASPAAGPVTPDCDATNQNFTISFPIVGGAGPYFVSGGTVTGNVFLSDPIANGQAYGFTIIDSNACVSQVVTGVFNCNCATTAGQMSSQLLGACEGGSVAAQHLGGQNLDGNDVSAYVLHTNSGAVPGTVFGQNTSGIFSFLPGMSYGTTYYVSYVVGNDLNGAPDPSDPCLSVAPGQPVVFYQNPVAGAAVENCDAANQFYQVSIPISGGQAPYTVGGNPVAGNTFVSGPIAGGTAYSFTIVDANGCPSLPVTGLYNCGCATNAGQMSASPLSACEGTTVTAQYLGGGNLDGNDVSAYVLHSGSGPALGTVWAENQTGEFGFQPGMNFGDTYYISVVAGDNAGGLPDLDDPCLSVTPGQPVVFLKVPTPSAGLDIGACGLTLDLNAVNYGLSGSWTQVSGPGSAVLATPDSVHCAVTAGSFGDYEFVWAESNGLCTATDTVKATFWSIPVISGLLETCNPVNTQYTVTFDVSGGAVPFAVAGLNGSFSGSTFTSVALADNSAYSFILTDLNGCPAAEITGQHDCLCATDAGDMVTTPAVFCAGTPASAVWNNNPGFDADDVLQFILHDQPGGLVGTVFATSSTPVFNFTAGLQTGVTYYISAIAGSNVAGSVDLNDPCLSVAPGAAVQWKALPTATLSGDATICAGSSTTLLFAGTGSYPLQVSFATGAGNSTVTLAGPQALGQSISPTATTTYSLLSVTDGTAPGCTSSLNQSVTVTVNQPLSPGTALAPAEYCEGFAIPVQLSGLLSGADAGGQWTDVSPFAAPAGSFNAAAGIFTTNAAPAGTYRFRYFTDAAAPCPDGSATVEVIIHPMPVADAGANQTLDCNQESAVLGGPNTTPNANYEWFLGTVPLSNTDTFTTSTPGNFTLIVSSIFGCTATDAVSVVLDPGLPVAHTLVKTDVRCYGDSDGRILVDGIESTHPPVLVALNGGTFGAGTDFYPLPPGKYTVKLQDAIGCEWESDTLVVVEPPQLTVDLGPNLVLNLGETALVEAVLTQSVAALDTLVWTPLLDTLRAGTLQQSFLPMRSSELALLAVDSNGCSATDRILITVKKPYKVFIPNIIKPAGSNNNYLTVFGGDDVAEIELIRIFDRWGEQLFEAANFPPNSLLVRWEGKFKGDDVLPGVYAYYAVVRFIDGERVLFTGDVTVVR